MLTLDRVCVFDVAAGGLLRLPSRAGATLTCNAGLLWVTQEGQLRDDILAAGDSVAVRGVTLVEAMSENPARFTLRTSCSPMPWLAARLWAQARKAHAGRSEPRSF